MAGCSPRPHDSGEPGPFLRCPGSQALRLVSRGGSCPLCAPDLPVCMRTLVGQCDREWVAFICTCVSLSLHSHGDALLTFPRDRLDPKTLDPAAPCEEGVPSSSASPAVAAHPLRMDFIELRVRHVGLTPAHTLRTLRLRGLAVPSPSASVEGALHLPHRVVVRSL